MKHLILVVLSLSVISSHNAAADSRTEDGQSYLSSLFSAATIAVADTVNAVSNADSFSSEWRSDEDPFESYNRWMFRFNNVLDEKALGPAAEKYRQYTPELVQLGVSNFFNNLGDVGVVTNSVLQGKLDQALDNSTRLLINSIVGIGGVIDVATLLDYRKNHEDFGQTFGVWGIPEGPYIVLPVLGPRTIRSAIGTAFDTYLQAETLGALSEAATSHDLAAEMLSLNLVQQRSKMHNKSALIEQAALDPYVFSREAYLSYRRCKVIDCDVIDYQSADPAPTESFPDELDLLD